MPSYGRWRRSKIVTPRPTPPSRAQEISGGIKNALDRGESIMKAKQSFINSGYTPQEVHAAVQLIKPKSLQAAKSLPGAPGTQSLPQAQASGATGVPATAPSKKTIIILSVVGVVILVAATAIGLFWDKIFGA
jgi:hypothetical protein